MRTVRTIFGLLASWAVLAMLAVLAIGSLGGMGTWLSPSEFGKRQPIYAAPTRVAVPMLPYRSDAGEPDPAVAKLRLKAEDQDLRSSRAAKPRPQPAPRAFATSRDDTRGFGGARVSDRHSSNF